MRSRYKTLLLTANGTGEWGSIPKTKKLFLIPHCLTLNIITYLSRVLQSNPGKRVAPYLHLGVVAIEKGAFGSPSAMIASFTYFTGSDIQMSIIG